MGSKPAKTTSNWKLHRDKMCWCHKAMDPGVVSLRIKVRDKQTEPIAVTNTELSKDGHIIRVVLEESAVCKPDRDEEHP